MKLRPFQIITLIHPKDEDGETKIIGSGIDLILAEDERQAGLLAARKIPEKDVKNINRIEVVVRPF